MYGGSQEGRKRGRKVPLLVYSLARDLAGNGTFEFKRFNMHATFDVQAVRRLYVRIG